MKNCFLLLLVSFIFHDCLHAQRFTLEAALAYPFPNELTTSEKGSSIAMAVNEKGKRNVYVANGPDFVLRKLTDYNEDDGQEITSIKISPDGKWVVYVRGGDHGAFDETIPRNPASLPTAPKIQLYSIPFAGGKPVLLSDGEFPVISPQSDKVVFIKNGQAWSVPIDGSQPAKMLFYARGETNSLQWSPDGKQLAFVSSRNDHSFIGIFTDSLSPIQWLDASIAKDQSPRWSPDGKKIVFIRRAASGGAIDSLTVDKHVPWSICVADAASGKAQEIWKAPETLRGSVPETQGRFNLNWAANERIIFVSYMDGWPHIYSIAATGGQPVLLTDGAFAVEHVKLSPDKKWVLFSTNTGPDKYDYDRRHIARVPVDKPAMEILTPGTGIETFPMLTGDGTTLVLMSATAQQPPLPAIMKFAPGKPVSIGGQLLPKDYPSGKMVAPTSVQFKAADGKTVYGQLYMPKEGPAKKPAVLFIHGGPERQMLLGWHYGDYYANTYALNQYLVSQGFIVLSVNYRLGIGYGFEFQQPGNTWNNGASEYLDIKAAGEWLSKQPAVDAKKIGVYGGSYGGFLTALALAKDSKLFAAGVDIHGEHNLMVFAPDYSNVQQAPDAELSRKLSWQSSPVSSLDTWTSPVLLIHGDDDGNVPFHQTVDLAKRFMEKKFPFESLIIPDETHHWMKHSNALKVDEAVADFLKRKLMTP
ncbi:prolyl oligopeptidase family serine peptidase [Danxiaibacter flavus]|uniref:Acyl-peptide hydrolase n=1 Tax=Danxiaibacter flavus TaxID=3049108 RepID=A0ABV3ZEG8_9BACT|nr:prolyl oligopeptidase family serine peptidase [Chitinophagaceae bacterium DXS]